MQWTQLHEKFARNNYTMPDGLSQAEQWYYQFLSLLYSRYDRRIIDRDKAIKEKQEAFHKMSEALREEEHRKSLSKWHSDLKIRIESAANAYAKDRTLENADKLYEAIYKMSPVKEEKK